MILAYGRAGGRSTLARRIYVEQFPNRRHPHPQTFRSLEERLRESGSFRRRLYDTGRRRSVRTSTFEEQVLERFAEAPRISMRHVARELNVDHLAV